MSDPGGKGGKSFALMKQLMSKQPQATATPQAQAQAQSQAQAQAQGQQQAQSQQQQPPSQQWPTANPQPPAGDGMNKGGRVGGKSTAQLMAARNAKIQQTTPDQAGPSPIAAAAAASAPAPAPAASSGPSAPSGAGAGRPKGKNFAAMQQTAVGKRAEGTTPPPNPGAPVSAPAPSSAVAQPPPSSAAPSPAAGGRGDRPIGKNFAALVGRGGASTQPIAKAPVQAPVAQAADAMKLQNDARKAAGMPPLAAPALTTALQPTSTPPSSSSQQPLVARVGPSLNAMHPPPQVRASNVAPPSPAAYPHHVPGSHRSRPSTKPSSVVAAAYAPSPAVASPSKSPRDNAKEQWEKQQHQQRLAAGRVPPSPRTAQTPSSLPPNHQLPNSNIVTSPKTARRTSAKAAAAAAAMAASGRPSGPTPTTPHGMPSPSNTNAHTGSVARHSYGLPTASNSSASSSSNPPSIPFGATIPPAMPPRSATPSGNNVTNAHNPPGARPSLSRGPSSNSPRPTPMPSPAEALLLRSASSVGSTSSLPHASLATAGVDTSAAVNTVGVPPPPLVGSKLSTLLNNIDPTQSHVLDAEAQECLLRMADEFVKSVVSTGCKLARHRKSRRLDARDVSLALRMGWGLTVPGLLPPHGSGNGHTSSTRNYGGGGGSSSSMMVGGRILTSGGGSAAMAGQKRPASTYVDGSYGSAQPSPNKRSMANNPELHSYGGSSLSHAAGNSTLMTTATGGTHPSTIATNNGSSVPTTSNNVSQPSSAAPVGAMAAVGGP